MLPVHWQEGILEQVDLELDVLRTADKVWVRDRDKFEQVRREWPMPDDIANQAIEACEHVRELVERGSEPFGQVGQRWLAHFLAVTSSESLNGQ